MTMTYTSRYGKIVKRCPGIHEYWWKGKLIASGSSISSPNPDCKPAKDDWAYCVHLRDEWLEEQPELAKRKRR